MMENFIPLVMYAFLEKKGLKKEFDEFLDNVIVDMANGAERKRIIFPAMKYLDKPEKE